MRALASVGCTVTKTMPAIDKPMARVIDNSSSEKPRCLLDAIRIFSRGKSSCMPAPTIRPDRLKSRWPINAQACVLLPCSMFIVGRLYRSVKARESNRSTLVFCHSPGYDRHLLRTLHLELPEGGLPERIMTSVTCR